MVGKMRHRITIESKSRSGDGYGGASVTWSTHATVWGEIKPASAAEQAFADRLENKITHKIKIRELSTVTAAMRIKYDGRTFKIKGVRSKEERGRWTEIMVEEFTE